MRRPGPPLNLDGPASREAGPSTTTSKPGARLSLIVGDRDDNTTSRFAGSIHAREESFARLQCQLMIASQLGIDPLTVAERAQSLLTATCAGWRRNRRCTSINSTVFTGSHDSCVLAQYHHDLLLLDHGLLDPSIETATPIQPIDGMSSGNSPKRKRTAG